MERRRESRARRVRDLMWSECARQKVAHLKQTLLRMVHYYYMDCSVPWCRSQMLVVTWAVHHMMVERVYKHQWWLRMEKQDLEKA